MFIRYRLQLSKMTVIEFTQLNTHNTLRLYKRQALVVKKLSEFLRTAYLLLYFTALIGSNHVNNYFLIKTDNREVDRHCLTVNEV